MSLQAEKWAKILLIPLFWLKFDDLTVTSALIILLSVFSVMSQWGRVSPLKHLPFV